jgi:hypothetical protein
VSNATEGFGVQVEDDGSFLTTVPTGTLTVSARSGSSISPSKTIEVRAGEETLVPDMVLEPVATLRVIAGCAAASATFEVLRGQQSCDGGQLTCDADLTLDVPAGNLRLVVHAPGRADESHDISLAPAEHKWLLVLRGP